MNEIKIFENKEFGKIRVQEINNEIWFVGKDVADILGYERADNAIRNHIHEEDKLMHQISASGQIRNMIIINESGLYSLILSSKLPKAKEFKRWVTSEVLPSIRKNGGYIQNQENLSDSELMAKALLVADKQIKDRDRIIEEQKPKVLFADSVSASQKSILVREMAKYLCQNGIDIGEKRLFYILRKNGYLVSKHGEDYNTPTQKSMDLGLFELKKTVILHSNGYETISKTPKITGKGQIYFVNKFLKGEL